MTSGYAAGVTVGAPPAIAIRRVRLWMVARLAGTESPLNVVTQFSDGVTTPPGVGLFAPPGGDTLTTPYVADLPASTRVFALYLTCGIQTGTGCNPSSLNVLDVRGAEVTYEESSLPKASIDGGELLTDGPQAGIRSLAFSASDNESGIAKLAVLLGKNVVASSDFTSECTYAEQAACPSTRNASIAVDTRKVPDGTYPISLRVTDAAGNEQTAQSAAVIRVANATSASSTGPSVAAASLTAAFVRNHRATVTVGYGTRVVVRGRLRGLDGAPIGGARIDIAEQSTNHGVTTAIATTGSDGVFSYAVPRGPSRTVRLSYAAGGAVKQLKLRVKASATLHVRLDGIVVRYHGRVLSKPLPPRGKIVEIQGRAPGSGWRTFATRRATRRGAFSGTYRLRIHRPGVRLQFRVRVPAQAGYPFVAHAGRPLSRVVR
jgi:hypothetical protein